MMNSQKRSIKPQVCCLGVHKSCSARYDTWLHASPRSPRLVIAQSLGHLAPCRPVPRLKSDTCSPCGFSHMRTLPKKCPTWPKGITMHKIVTPCLLDVQEQIKATWQIPRLNYFGPYYVRHRYSSSAFTLTIATKIKFEKQKEMYLLHFWTSGVQRVIVGAIMMQWSAPPGETEKSISEERTIISYIVLVPLICATLNDQQ